MLKMPTIHKLLNKQYSMTVSATKLTCNRSHSLVLLGVWKPFSLLSH